MSLRVLAVCTGNICRSPFAQAALEERLSSLPSPIAVSSAGTHALVGAPMHEWVSAELVRLGVSPRPFRARQLAETMSSSADLILTMTRDQRARVLEDQPRALRRTFTLREFAALIGLVDAADHATDLTGIIAAAAARRADLSALAPDALDIADPYRLGRDAFRVMADEVDAAARTIAESLARLAR